MKKQGTIERFRDEQRNEGAYDYRDRGLQTVALKQIVGSVNRYLDFDSEFRLKKDKPKERLTAIREAVNRAKPLPPVDLFKIKNKYFVLDGNHRIAVAKEQGFKDINARVVEFLPSRETPENVLYRKRNQFVEKTGLPDSIVLTEPNQYGQLLGQIEKHRQHLEQQEGRTVSFVEAADDWQATIYRPLSKMIANAGLASAFPHRTVADLYTYISVHQWERGHPHSYGSVIDGVITKDMEEFRDAMKNKPESDYPEMRQEITVFVLMNITTKKELPIIDKLMALEEVREVHSVHGSIDLIAKIVLTRDLVSSDAEVVTLFVQDKIRHIPGILSTQTLIPGLSRVK
jgi:uncharacterized ParB-like nuclease family protein